jgi:hypothetical protein
MAEDIVTATQPIVLRVFLASPGDVPNERAFVRELLETKLPYDPWRQRPVFFEVLAWDHPHGGAPMLGTMDPQSAVTKYTGRPSECDIVIVILWSRLGTHLDVSKYKRSDGSRYGSGTEWEYEDALSSGKPVILVFFNVGGCEFQAPQKCLRLIMV